MPARQAAPGLGRRAVYDELVEQRLGVGRYRADALVVSLGVDTFEGDPISAFKLASRHFPQIGAMIAGLRLPTVVVLEGGYAVEEIGENVVGVLTAF